MGLATLSQIDSLGTFDLTLSFSVLLCLLSFISGVVFAGDFHFSR